MSKVLIVDDDADLRETLAEIVQKAGYTTDIAASGEEALEKTGSEKFDIIMLDLIMPGIRGTDLLMLLKKRTPKTKVIMMTAFATVQNAVDAIQKGASDYITKPFNIEELLTTIRRIIEEAKFERKTENVDIDRTLNILSNSIRRHIIKLLHTNDKMRLMEITRELDMEDHTKVVFHMKTMKKAEIVVQNEDKSYNLTPKGRKVLECLKLVESDLSE